MILLLREVPPGHGPSDDCQEPSGSRRTTFGRDPPAEADGWTTQTSRADREGLAPLPGAFNQTESILPEQAGF
jgi:hypothetical protein